MSSFSQLAAISVRLLITLTMFGSVIAISIAISFRLTPAASTRVRYVAAVTAFLIAALLPIAATLAGARTLGPIESSSIADRPSSDGTSHSRAGGDKVALTPAPGNQFWMASNAASDRINSFARPMANGPVAVVLSLAWAAGAVLLLGRELAGHLFLRRARRKWLLAAENLRKELVWPDGIPLFVDEHEPPSTIGLLRPAVVLPLRVLAELPLKSAQRIARHELAHAKWRDPLINALLRIVRAGLWPCVPLWFLERMVHAEREASADQAADDRPSSSKEFILEAADYAASLVSIARWSQRVSTSGRYGLVATQVSSGAAMEQRIKRLLNSRARLSRARLILGSAIFVCGICGTAFLPVVSHTLDREDRHQVFDSRDRTLAQTRDEQRARDEIAQASNGVIRLIAALNGRDWQVAGEVESALKQIRQSGAIQPLIAALKDRDWQNREKVAWALGQLGDREAAPPLIVAWKDETSEARNTMAWALGMIGDSRAVEPLIVAWKDETREGREMTAWALGMIGDSRAVEPLIPGLKENSPDVRRSAAWALGQIGDSLAVEPLIVALKDESSAARHASAWALGMIGDRRAVDALKAALKDEDRLVRDRAAWALEQLARR